jgi:hypothetical protein
MIVFKGQLISEWIYEVILKITDLKDQLKI